MPTKQWYPLSATFCTPSSHTVNSCHPPTYRSKALKQLLFRSCDLLLQTIMYLKCCTSRALQTINRSFALHVCLIAGLYTSSKNTYVSVFICGPSHSIHYLSPEHGLKVVDRGVLYAITYSDPQLRERGISPIILWPTICASGDRK